MITIHELGHYLAGKLLGFKINEFSIGFGKALFKRKSKKTGEVFAIRMIPLGGYCAFESEDIAGSAGNKTEQAESEQLALERELAGKKPLHNFNEAPPWKRLIVLFSGAFFNFVSAILFSFILLMIAGYTQGVRLNEGAINAGTPNTANLQAGDTILSVNGERFTLLRNFGAVMSQFEAGETIVFRIDRAGIIVYEDITVFAHPTDQRPMVGLNLRYADIVFQPMGFFEALGRAFGFTFQLAWVILSFLWMLITGQIGLSGVGGPISTVSVMAQSLSSGFINIFILLPLISVNLAVFNLLPIPALDGARMVFVGIEWVRGKPINPEIEGRIHLVGLVLLMGLVLLADMNFLFGGRSMLELFGHWRL